jgi:hypothetical protein
MANVFTSNPMVLDTVWTATTIPAALLSPTAAASTSPPARNAPLNVKRIEWYGPASTSDSAVITDINGNVILEGTCETALVSQVLWSSGNPTLPLKMGGWVLKTLGSGKLLIYS